MITRSLTIIAARLSRLLWTIRWGFRWAAACVKAAFIADDARAYGVMRDVADEYAVKWYGAPLARSTSDPLKINSDSDLESHP